MLRTLAHRLLTRTRHVSAVRSRALHAKFPAPTPLRRVTALTALGLASFAVSAPSPFMESAERRTNPDTQHSFPATLRTPRTSLTLLNSAVRTVTVLQFYTYTLGLYVPDTTLHALAAQHGTQLTAAQATAALAQLGEAAQGGTEQGAATQGDVLALLRIIPYRRATPPHLLGSLSRATCQRVKELHGTDESRDWCAQLSASLPGVKEVAPGHVVDIELRADGTARVYFEQQLTAELPRDSAAVTALLQLFTGPKSRTAAVHQALVEGLRQALAK